MTVYDNETKVDKSLDINVIQKINTAEPLTYISITGTIESLLLSSNLITVSGTIIDFYDDLWDFSDIINKEFVTNNFYAFDFSKISKTKNNYYLCLLKLFTLEIILKNTIFQVENKATFYIVDSFLLYLIENDINNLEYITTKNVIDFIENKNIKERTKVRYKAYIKVLLLFYQKATSFQFNNNIYNYLDFRDINQINLEIKANKLPLLPTEFMNKLTELLLIYFNDNSKTIKNRRIAALLYIETQTGLRPSEIMLLERDCLKYFEIDGIEGYKLEYRCTKSMVRSNEVDTAQTIASDHVIKVVKSLCELESDRLLAKDIKTEELRKFLNQFVINNAEKLGNITDKPNKQFAGKCVQIDKNKFINIPLQKQFRVYFATELRTRGFSDMAVSSLLNHHDEKMFDYYGRDINDVQENPHFSAKIFKEILTDESELLGPKALSYMKKIKSFINDKDVKIASDLDEIIEKQAKELPIRMKLGGICMKANPSRLCEHDANTDEYLCAYGLCQNQMHFYYNLPYYYQQFEDFKKTYKHNLDLGYKQQSQKELHKIHNVINDKIIPEIISLKKFIDKKGVEAILKQHPSLDLIINNLEDIEKDLNLWKNKK